MDSKQGLNIDIDIDIDIDNKKYANYDKISETGFIIPETVLIDGDIIIGKIYKDNDCLKKCDNNYVAKVYKDKDNDNDKLLKTKIRSNKTIPPGDMICSSYVERDIFNL